MRNEDLPVRTQAPIRHRERFEFISDGWLDAARDHLAARIARHRESIAGQRWVMCERYTNIPPHLGYRGGEGAVHIVIDDGQLIVGRGVLEDAHFSVTADYHQSAWVGTAVYGPTPERQARLMLETQHLFGRVFDIRLGEPTSPEMMRVVAGLHDHLAKRTVGCPDIAHKIDALGLGSHTADLEEQGYTVVEGAFSDEMAKELAEDLARLIAETRETVDRRRHVASMLPARGALWEEIAVHPRIHTLAQHMLGADCNLGQSLGFTKRAGQDLHAMHNDPPHPDTGNVCCNLTTIWALDDFTETSGSTLVVPGSHLQNCVPPPDARERAVELVMPKGSVALWHGSAIREDEGLRMTIHNTYLRNWVRTFDSYLEIDPAVLERNPPAFTTLCGIDDLYGKNTFAGPDYARSV